MRKYGDGAEFLYIPKILYCCIVFNVQKKRSLPKTKFRIFTFIEQKHKTDMKVVACHIGVFSTYWTLGLRVLLDHDGFFIIHYEGYLILDWAYVTIPLLLATFDAYCVKHSQPSLNSPQVDLAKAGLTEFVIALLSGICQVKKTSKGTCPDWLTYHI